MKVERKLQVLAIACLIAGVAGAASAPSAGAASAPRWKVKKAFLGDGVTKNFIARNTEALRLDSPLLGVRIESPKNECVMTGKIVGSAAGKPGTKKEVGLVCLFTKVLVPDACTVRSPGQETGVVTTMPMKSTLAWETKEGEAAGSLYSAEGNGPIGEIILEGDFCPEKGTFAIEGETLAPFTPVVQETKVAAEAFPEAFPTKWWDNENARKEQPITQLTLGGAPAWIRTTLEVKLNPEEEFGYAPG